MDVDIYHTKADRAAYSGGMFWFTDHYLHAQTSTHRTYSILNRPDGGGGYGGGPGSEHNYTSGLLLYYWMTGNPHAREAVIGLADWVIAMEDGGRTIFGLIDDGPTGLATAGHAKPGRGGANSINALLDAWKLTHDTTYLEFSEALIRRCVHPLEEVARYDLLNVEVQWSYTMFLTSLAKYLRCKEEAGQLDAMYQYAHQTLVGFGKWMLAYEKPYFDQMEKLEYPTEAWAAQEFRKANAIRLAAQLCGRALAHEDAWPRGCAGRSRWNDLLRFETRLTARSLAIVMVEGLLDCAFRSREIDAPPLVELTNQFEDRQPFTTQRHRVKSCLRSPRKSLRSCRPSGESNPVGPIFAKPTPNVSCCPNEADTKVFRKLSRADPCCSLGDKLSSVPRLLCQSARYFLASRNSSPCCQECPAFISVVPSIA